MATFRVNLHVDSEGDAEPSVPLTPLDVRRGGAGQWIMTFDVEGESFDSAAGRLWGEVAACGLHVREVEATPTCC
jgi:hypothetical protein